MWKGILFFNFLFHSVNFFPAPPLGSSPRPVDGKLWVNVFNTPTNASGPYMLVNLLSQWIIPFPTLPPFFNLHLFRGIHLLFSCTFHLSSWKLRVHRLKKKKEKNEGRSCCLALSFSHFLPHTFTPSRQVLQLFFYLNAQGWRVQRRALCFESHGHYWAARSEGGEGGEGRRRGKSLEEEQCLSLLQDINAAVSLMSECCWCQRNCISYHLCSTC